MIITKTCKLDECGKTFEYENTQGQSRRAFCDDVCRNKYNNIKNRGKKYYEAGNARQQERCGVYEPEKIECLICRDDKKENRYFHKLGAHIYNYHGVLSREYRKKYGLDIKRGQVSKTLKHTLATNVKDNYDKVVADNLVRGGKATRFKKGDEGIGKYKRSKQTMKRLKQQSFIKKDNNNNEQENNS